MSHIPVWLALISSAFFLVIFARKLGWIKHISEVIKVKDEFGVLLPTLLSLTVPFLIARFSNWFISDFDSISSSGLLTPTATLVAASMAAFMVSRTIENSRKNERIKNTVFALDNGLFKSKSLTKFELACTLLDEEIKS